MLTDIERDLVRRTAEHAKAHHDDAAHTVAGGLLTASGRIVLGMNTFHFLGGPCGEIAALSNHAASAAHDPIVASAAVHGPTGDVLAPCGKCRQVLHDIDPGIRFVVRDASGLFTRTARELLPFAYDPSHHGRPQRIFMWEGYEALIRSGAKRRTIRIDDPFRPGPAEIVFEKEGGEDVVLPATVTDVRPTTRDALTAADAKGDGFTDLGELQEALARHYPGLEDGAPVDVVSFEIAEQA
ncbi:ASCH domain-containing protein [Brachybacterium sp. ACRRE]|uniref:ASCH domain-containing protein n=1 Tax=Brachybacterium sp. ACRRE TaxID=2918184 RepID=UPI001EF1760D|nr:ASCH domain-containing protein [Brachybacterium sp. ACRRE]MCG7310023.1 ASCH domain-containing protein [Brachybacterium sp. ACRRE]